MRVISGIVGGRRLKAVPGKGTRPTADKVKEAIFSKIGPYFQEGMVLDLFAGTGGLGIEALSRGMEHAIFVDKDQKSVEMVIYNLTSIGLLDKAEVYRNDAMRALKALAKRELKFDLVFIDPPYRQKLMEELLCLMQSYSLFSDHAYVVLEHDAATSFAIQIGQLHLGQKAIYRDTAISIYTFCEESSE